MFNIVSLLQRAQSFNLVRLASPLASPALSLSEMRLEAGGLRLNQGNAGTRDGSVLSVERYSVLAPRLDATVDFRGGMV